ncbi:MAG TPA: response regulator transcription factor [Polyangiaceae bacterium]|jgi:DNA-binding response OmpR family regulator|nr:response regulator transcription factor [Polyangiaceae bacterium]
MALRVLIVDDDVRLFELLESYLAQNGIGAEAARDGQAALRAIERGGFDAVLLDVMMPGMDGLSVLRKLRESSDLPVLMLTAKGDETDRVVGLELGADDYLPKPFSPRELLARLRAVVRRTQAREIKKRLSISGVQVDLESRRVERGGARVELTGLEFDVLVALIQRAGRVVPRAALLELAGRNDVTVSDRTVDVHVSHLRKKLGDDPPQLIRTVRGVGYMFARDDP